MKLVMDKTVVTFGEIMMRLNPKGFQRFVQASFYWKILRCFFFINIFNIHNNVSGSIFNNGNVCIVSIIYACRSGW